MQSILGTEKISKLFVKYGVPAVISMIIVGTQTIIDGLFVSFFINSYAMASINIASPYMSIIAGFSFMIATGSMSIIGRKLGEGDKEAAQNTFRTACVCVLTISLIIGILGVAFNRQIALLFGSDDTLLNNVSTYIRTLAFFAPIIAFSFLFSISCRLIGKPNLHFFATLMSLVMNITLNYIFIGLLSLEVMGAALATGLSFTTSFLIMGSQLVKKSNVINTFTGHFKMRIVGPMFYNGSSEAVTSASTAVTTYLFNVTFMTIAGVDGVTAFTIINYIASFATLIMFGISDGIGPIISYNFGSGNYKRVKTTIKYAFLTNFIAGVVIYACLFIFGRPLIELYEKENMAIIELAVYGSRIFGLGFILNGANIIMSGYFTSIGKAKESILISGGRGVLFVTLGIMTLPLIFKITGIWMAVPVAEVLTFTIGMLMIRKEKPLQHVKAA